MSHTEGKVHFPNGRPGLVRPDGRPVHPSGDAAEQFLAGLESDLARLAADPIALADYQREVRELEGTIADGLEEPR